MNRELSDLLIATFAVSIICATVVLTYWLSLQAKRKARLERGASSDAIHAEVDAVRVELGAQIAELQERVDFTERLLAQRREPKELQGPGATPV